MIFFGLGLEAANEKAHPWPLDPSQLTVGDL